MKKRILIALPNYERGGIGRSLKNLLDLLDGTELDIDVYCGNPSGIYKGEMRNCYELKPCYLHRALSENLRCVHGFTKFQSLFWKTVRHTLLKLVHWDLLHFASWFISRKITNGHYDVAIAYYEDYTSWWVENSAIPIKIVWIHNDYSHSQIYEQCKPDWSKFNYIVCVSQCAQKAFIKIFPRYASKVKCFYNITAVKDVVEKSMFQVNDVRFCTNVFTIVSIGRIAAVKNFNSIPVIAKKLIDQGCDCFNWYIIGNGSELETSFLVSEIRRNKVENKVILLGEKKNPYPYLAKSDLYVCTSVYESYGIVIDEAKVLGIPVLSTNYDAVHEVLPKNFGIIAHIDEFPQILHKIIREPQLLTKFKNKLNSYHPDNRQYINKFIDMLQV